MPASPATIELLARDTVQAPDALMALRALNALRQELDQVEPELVGRALGAEASWSQIARALGVSKQAAHRKHRHLTEEDPLRFAGEPKMLVTSEARRSIQLARREAKVLGQPAIGTEHILLGILRCRNSHAVKALNALGVTHESARACLQPTMTGATIEGDPTHLTADTENGVSRHARRILAGSLREAVKRHEGYIGVEHLLLSLLTDSRNGAVQTLEALGATPGKIRRQLDREWKKLSEAPVQQPA